MKTSATLLAIASVTISFQGLSAQDAGLVVRDLTFSGNQYVDDYTLRRSIATSWSGYWERHWFTRWTPFGEKRFLDETELRRDVVRILLLYRRSGFYQAQVDTVVRRSETEVRVEFVVDEGDPIGVDSIWVTGTEPMMSARQILQQLPLQVGDPFDRLIYLASSDSIRATLRNQGYPFVQVFHHFDENRPEGTVEVGFTVVPGPLAVIDSVRVVGPREIDDNVVRRMLTIKPGQVYSEQRMIESQRELYRLGVFEYVDITLADSMVGDDSLVTIQAQVGEGRLKHIQAGLGFGTLDCFRASSAWTIRDFLGGGRTFDLSARLSKFGAVSPFAFAPPGFCPQIEGDIEERRAINYDVTANLRFPYVLSPRNSAVLTLSSERRSEINAYVRTEQGVGMSITRQTRWNIPLTLSYSLSRGQTLADDVTLCERFNLCDVADQAELRSFQIQSAVGFSAVRDRTNTPLNPTRGNRLHLDGSFSSSAIGSDAFAQFFKWVVEGAWYRPIGRATVLAARVRMGLIWPPNLTSIGTLNAQVVPTHERFYLGGPNSVRGFRQNELGPVVYVESLRPIDTLTLDPLNPPPLDTLVSPTGGNQLFLANVELRFRMPGFNNRVGGAVFVDAGDVFERLDTAWPFHRLRVTPGAGFRVATPLGPIRVDIAYNPHDPDPNASAYSAAGTRLLRLVPFAPPRPSNLLGRLRLNFSIGEAF